MPAFLPKPTYQSFWSLRGSGCFWVTEQVSYRLGALLAIPCHALRLTPNHVTFLGFMVASVGIGCVALEVPESRTLQGWVILASLMLSSGLDCTDGILARFNRQGSVFGSLFDKIADLATMLVIVGALGVESLNLNHPHFPIALQRFFLVWSIGPRALFSTLSWLKDSQLHAMRRSGPVNHGHGNGWRLRRFVGNVFDEPVFRIGAGVAWMLDLYWEFSVAFNTGLFVVFVGYLLKTYRECGAMEDHMETVVEADARKARDVATPPPASTVS